ncbi:MAG TPA: serine/threonine-protein kinase [Microthrixaceae bacterium]|nr:serine/threonine-protein kinase [Microthrixaceae bacterium]
MDPPQVDQAQFDQLIGDRFPGRFVGAIRLDRGSSRIYAVEDRLLDRQVVVKFLLDARLLDQGMPREAVVQASVSDHPNVLTLFDAGVSAAGVGFLVLERVSDENLETRRQSGPSSITEVLARGVEVADALAVAHDRGVIHCDVKPSNVLLGLDGTARLCDFGIAIRADGTLGTFEHLRGSLRYVPPELFDGARPTPANDVYSLALTLWAAASGAVPFGEEELPFRALLARVQSETIRLDGSPLGDAVSAEARDILGRALARDHQRRPTARELGQALEVELRRLTAVGGSPPKPPPNRRRRLAFAASGALVAVAVFLGSVQVARSSGGDETDEAPFCEVYQQMVTDRGELFEDIASELEVATSPVDVVQHLVEVYPARFARVIEPWLARTAALAGSSPTMRLSLTDLQDLALADALRSLTAGKALVFNGEDGTFDASQLPGELREPARLVSEATALAAERCPRVDVNLRAAKARMNSAILANLLDPVFMNDFFSDPASLDTIDVRQASLMISIARPFFEALLRDHWDWFIELLVDNPDVRSAAVYDAPDLILTALAAHPQLIEIVGQEPWKVDLVRGLERLPAMARLGLPQLYGEQLRLLGIEVP